MTPVVAPQNYGLVRIGRIELSDGLIFSIIFELDEAKMPTGTQGWRGVCTRRLVRRYRDSE